jgi:hypothetical protein
MPTIFAQLLDRYKDLRNRVRSAVLAYLVRDLGPMAALVVGYSLGWVARDDQQGKTLRIHLKA